MYLGEGFDCHHDKSHLMVPFEEEGEVIAEPFIEEVELVFSGLAFNGADFAADGNTQIALKAAAGRTREGNTLGKDAVSQKIFNALSLKSIAFEARRTTARFWLILCRLDVIYGIWSLASNQLRSVLGEP